MKKLVSFVMLFLVIFTILIITLITVRADQLYSDDVDFRKNSAKFHALINELNEEINKILEGARRNSQNADMYPKLIEDAPSEKVSLSYREHYAIALKSVIGLLEKAIDSQKKALEKCYDYIKFLEDQISKEAQP